MIASLLLIMIAAAAKAVMDCSAESKLKWKPESYWWKDFSWQNKWKISPDGFVMVGTERWPTSSTITCFLTDAWHLAQFIFLGCIFALPFTMPEYTNPILAYLCLRVFFGAAFEGFYRLLKKG